MPIREELDALTEDITADTQSRDLVLCQEKLLFRLVSFDVVPSHLEYLVGKSGKARDALVDKILQLVFLLADVHGPVLKRL